MNYQWARCRNTSSEQPAPPAITRGGVQGELGGGELQHAAVLSPFTSPSAIAEQAT